MKEPEEIIESRLIEILRAASPGADVVGALSPMEKGDEKVVSPSSISVFVDQSSQDFDWAGSAHPCTWAARIMATAPLAEDASGAGFRDLCRRIRAALIPLLGDGCATLNAEDFYCDAFLLDSTSTASTGDAESWGMSKTYNATVKGRFIKTQENE